jgi:SPP1 family predicted phage head-tail adaptor
LTNFPAGKLDRRIRIMRSSETVNALNEPVLTWGVLADVAAGKKDVSDGEKLRAKEMNASITTRFHIRWSAKVSDVDARDRILFDGREFDIVAVKEIDRRVGLEITAAARAERV